jgi:hypothetical protein
MASVIDEWRSMGHWWNDIDTGKLKYLQRNLSQCHLLHHKYHMDWPGIEPRPPTSGWWLTTWVTLGPFRYLYLVSLGINLDEFVILFQEIMQKLRENKLCNSLVMENPLVQCLVQLFDNEHSVNSPKNIHELMLCVKKLNKDITSQEGKVFDCLFDKHRNVCIQK